MRLLCAALMSASLFAHLGHRDPTTQDLDANPESPGRDSEAK